MREHRANQTPLPVRQTGGQIPTPQSHIHLGVKLETYAPPPAHIHKGCHIQLGAQARNAPSPSATHTPRQKQHPRVTHTRASLILDTPLVSHILGVATHTFPNHRQTKTINILSMGNIPPPLAPFSLSHQGTTAPTNPEWRVTPLGRRHPATDTAWERQHPDSLPFSTSTPPSVRHRDPAEYGQPPALLEDGRLGAAAAGVVLVGERVCGRAPAGHGQAGRPLELLVLPLVLVMVVVVLAAAATSSSSSLAQPQAQSPGQLQLQVRTEGCPQRGPV